MRFSLILSRKYYYCDIFCWNPLKRVQNLQVSLNFGEAYFQKINSLFSHFHRFLPTKICKKLGFSQTHSKYILYLFRLSQVPKAFPKLGIETILTARGYPPISCKVLGALPNSNHTNFSYDLHMSNWKKHHKTRDWNRVVGVSPNVG